MIDVRGDARRWAERVARHRAQAAAVGAWLAAAGPAAVARGRHPVTSQLVGAVAAVCGLWLLVGAAVTLLIGGVLLGVVGTLREMDGLPARRPHLREES